MGFLKSRSTSRAEKITQFQATVCEYGTPVQDIVGTTKVNPNVINWKDFYAKEVRTTQKSGKHKHTDISYKYYVYLELALSETITDLGKVWCGSKEYSSLREANNSNDQGFPLVLHKDGGKSEFMTSAYPDLAVDYKNLAYLCSKGNKWNGTYLGENTASVPSYSFEVKGQLLNTGDGTDVNPADYFLYLLKRIGIYNGTDPEEAIIQGIGNFRQYCKATNLYVSSKLENSQKPVHDLIEDLCELLDIYFFWSDDKFKVVVKDDRDYTLWHPDKTVVFDLDNNDFLPQNNGAGVIFSRKDSSEIYNRFTLSYLNRENHYEEESVSYEFPDDVRERGLNQKGTIDGHWFYSKERAIKVVELQARKNKREQNKYKFALDWAYAVLEPGDLVTLTDLACGLDKQIAMVESVVEAEDGVIQVEALQYSDGEYSAAIINPSPDKDNFFDYNIDPSATAEPVIFQPPSAATLTGNELWIAMKGTDSTWGGANIYIANQDQNYQFLAQHRQSAQYGKIVGPLYAWADSFTARINGDFENMTLEDAQNGNSMFWVDGECMSYRTATINLDGSWTFSDLVRGQYGTTPSYHEAGTTAVYCDGSIYTIELSKKDFDRTVFFRFPSVNVFAACGQDVSDAVPYSYYISEYYIPSVQNINAYTRYTSTENAVSYSIQVEWNPPELDTYSQAQVWYKEPTGAWQFAASGYNSVTIPNVEVGEEYTIAVCTEDIYGVCVKPINSPQVTLTVVTKAVTPNAPENVSVTAKDKITVSWNFVTNADIRFYEVRTDTNPGVMNGNFLGRTTSNSIIVNNVPRQGTVYVYAYGVTNVYSQPGAFTYNFPRPAVPSSPILSALVSGFSVRTDAIPVGSHSIHVYVSDEDSYYTQNRVSQYNCTPRIYYVSYAFVDAFGESPRSPEATITVKATIPPELIESGAITKDKLDAETQKAIEDAQHAGDVILQGVYSKDETNRLVNDAIAGAENRIDGEIAGQLNDAKAEISKNFITSAQADTKINNAIAGAEGRLNGEIAGQLNDAKIEISKNFITSTQADEKINSAVSGVNTTIQNIEAELNKAPGKSGYKSINDLKKTQDGFTATMAKQEGTNQSIFNQINMANSGIQAVIGNLNTEDPAKSPYKSITALDVKANGIKTLVEENKTTQDGINTSNSTLIQQNKDGIEGIVSNLRKAPDQSGYKAITDLKLTADGAVLTANSAKQTAEGAETKVGTLEFTVNGLKSTVSSNKETQDGINDGFTSQINQTDGRISAVIAELDKDGTEWPDYENCKYKAITSLRLGVDGLNTTVTNNKNALEKQITDVSIKADGIKALVEDNKTAQDGVNQSNSSLIQQNKDYIESVVQELNKDGTEWPDYENCKYKAVSSIKQTANGAVITANSAKETAEGAETRVGTLEFTVNGLSSTVSSNKETQDGINDGFTSQINQTSDKISAVIVELDKDGTEYPNYENCKYKSIVALKAGVDGLSATVTNNKNALEKQIADVSVKADGIKTLVTNNKTAQDGVNESNSSLIQQNKDYIESVVLELNKDGMEWPYEECQYKAVSSIKQTANSASITASEAKTAATGAETKVSKLEVTVGGISTTVADNKTAQDKANEGFTSRIDQASNKITSVITELGKAPGQCTYSAITQLNDSLGLKVGKGDIISSINLNDQGVITLDGKYIEITGDTKIGNNIITKDMIQAGAVTARQIDISGGKKGAKIIIEENLIRVYDANGTIRVQLGVWQ